MVESLIWPTSMNKEPSWAFFSYWWFEYLRKMKKGKEKEEKEREKEKKKGEEEKRGEKVEII